MNRIISFDFARALAILGMMFVNYKIVFADPEQTSGLLNSFIALFEGRAAAVFLVLAGIGVSLMTKKGFENKDLKQRKNDKLALRKRAVFLFILGMMLYYVFEWHADILHYYGVYMLLITGFIYMKQKNIKKAVVMLLAITLIGQSCFNYQLGWDINYTTYSDFSSISGFIRNTFFNGYHPVLPWLSFILIGLLIGRMDFSNMKYIRKIAFNTLLLALLLELFSTLLIGFFNHQELVIYYFSTKPMNPSVMYVITASNWAVSFICFCHLFVEKMKGHFWVNMLSKAGEMALSHYVFHCTLVLIFVYTMSGFTYQKPTFVVSLSVGVFFIMIIFSLFWRKKFKRGPLELLMRKLT